MREVRGYHKFTQLISKLGNERILELKAETRVLGAAGRLRGGDSEDHACERDRKFVGC